MVFAALGSLGLELRLWILILNSCLDSKVLHSRLLVLDICLWVAGSEFLALDSWCGVLPLDSACRFPVCCSCFGDSLCGISDLDFPGYGFQDWAPGFGLLVLNIWFRFCCRITLLTFLALDTWLWMSAASWCLGFLVRDPGFGLLAPASLFGTLGCRFGPFLVQYA